jgi:CPA1 family monovalent cation:H+ antiporter
MEGEPFSDGRVLVALASGNRAAAQEHRDRPRSASDAGRLTWRGVGAVAPLSSGARRILTAILASAVLVFATSCSPERLHASPVIAVVVAGVMIGRTGALLTPSQVLALQNLGDQRVRAERPHLPARRDADRARTLVREAGSIALAPSPHAGRAIAVYGCFGVLRAVTRGSPTRWQHVMVIGNIGRCRWRRS